eukprot:Pgem_evm1s17942
MFKHFKNLKELNLSNFFGVNDPTFYKELLLEVSEQIVTLYLKYNKLTTAENMFPVMKTVQYLDL